MVLRFEWDPKKAAANLDKHKVSFEKATTVFGDPIGRITDDPRHSVGERRFVLLGRSDQQHLLAVMFADGERSSASSAHAMRLVANGENMKRVKKSARGTSHVDPDEILPEYDFSRARPNKYASRYQKGALVVTLDAEVAQVFQSAKEVNETLRSLARIIRADRGRQSAKAPGA